jgi:voltage-dependent anion channel protein 2
LEGKLIIFTKSWRNANAVVADLQDFGKSSNDLLGKDFPIGITSLEVKTTTPSNVAFKIAGNKPDGVVPIAATAEAKYTDRKNGLTLTQSWTNANALLTSVELDNHVVNGLKLELSTTLKPVEAKGADEKPKTAAKAAILNATYKMPGFHSRASLDVFKVCTPKL